MSYKHFKITATYANGSWAFVEASNSSNRVKFEQALIDATFVAANRVEGYVRSIHGIEQSLSDNLDSDTRSAFGIKAAHRLGRVGTLHRVRLMPDGVIEREAYT